MWGTKASPKWKKAGALLCALGLLACAGCGGQENGQGLPQAQLAEKKTTYHTLTVAPQDLTRTAQLSCDPSYRMISPVYTGGASYKLKELRVSRNQRVEKGDVIAVLQGLGSATDIEQKELEIAAYRAGAAEMKAYYESLVTAASAQPAATQREQTLRALRTEYAQTELALYEVRAEATLQAMEAELAACRAAAGESYLYAPLTGSIRTMNTKYKVGDVMPAHTEFCSVYGEDSLLLYATSANGCFVFGREVTVSIGRTGSSRSIQGTVVSSPEVAPPQYYSTGVFVRVDPTQIDDRNFQGRLEVSFTVMKDVLAVPKTAVTTTDGMAVLTLLDGDAAHTRSVVRGPSVGNQVAVLQGLREGDQVVVSSYNS